MAAVVLLLAATPHGTARDDQVVGDTAPAADAAAEAGGEFVVTLDNGDRLTGGLVALDPRRLRVRPDVMGEAEIDLPAGRLDRIDRRVEIEPVEPRGDRILPLDGGVIHGELTRVDQGVLVIDAHLVGPLRLPLDAVSAFVRQGRDLPERKAAPRLHEVHAAAGNRLLGAMEFTPTGVAIVAEGMSATVAMRNVDAILFPVAENPAGPEAASAEAACTLELLNGAELVGRGPLLEEGRITIGTGPGRTVAVPLAHVARVVFGSGLAGMRRVVFWSACTDGEEERAHMIDVARKGLPPGWHVDADDLATDIAELEAALRRAGVLVVPEMEEFDADSLPPAADVGRVLQAFLGRGGTVVLAGLDGENLLYWNATGLLTVSAANRVTDGSEFTFVAGHRLGRGAGDSFAAVNGTHEYQTEDPGLKPVATRTDGNAAVLVKQAGRGRLVLLGMDYFETNAAVDQVLVNAVMLGRGR
jgi:hypothetical protein